MNPSTFPFQFLVPGDEVCRHFETEYEMLATALSAETHIIFYTVDAAAFPDLAKQESVNSFPMVKLYRRCRQPSPFPIILSTFAFPLNFPPFFS